MNVPRPLNLDIPPSVSPAQMADDAFKPRNGSSSPTIAFASGRRSFSPLRQRPLTRAATIADVSNPSQNKRRSSLVSASTDDFLLPRPSSPDARIHEPSSLLHSAPLALALLPGLIGLFVSKDAGDVLTDLTLLVLASVFLNWCIRLPWDWYHSAQAIRLSEDTTCDNDIPPAHATIEETDEKSTEATHDKSPIPGPSTKTDKASEEHGSATRELRIHENVSLLSCFLGPLVGAWLLHTIRSALSRPAEGLVSDYNLSIFVLASEVRPLAHVLRLIQARTMHLQRVIAENPHARVPMLDPTTIADISTRLNELETHVADTNSNTPATADPNELTPQLTSAVRKSMQSKLDAITRAIRRYEKRATALGMQMESRMQDLDTRVKDALTLAAAAERSREGSAMILLNFLCALIVVPARVAFILGAFVLRVPLDTLQRVKAWVQSITGLGGAKAKARSQRESDGRNNVKRSKRIVS